MYQKKLKKYPSIIQKYYGYILRKSFPRYHPIISHGKILRDNDRESEKRWEIIKKELKHDDTFLDLGSAEGFFVLLAAKEMGCLAIGVDADVRRLAMAEHQLVTEEINGAGFIQDVIDLKFMGKIPAFDVVLFMSVLHHVMAEKGEDYGLELMRSIRLKTKKIMIFETGQSNEKIPNASKLPNMGENPSSWTEGFLKKAGWSKIEKIGESISYDKKSVRPIFKVTP